MKNWKNATRLPVYIGIAAILSACGASSSTQFGAPISGALSNNTSSGGGGINPTPTPTPTPTSTLAPALSFSNFSMSGSGGKNPVYSTKTQNGAYISTDNILKVQVQAMPGTSTLQAPSGQYSGFSTNYHCISYQVSIYDDSGTMIGSQTTNLLASDSQNSVCTGNPSTQVLDFSGSVQHPHGGIDVRVQPLAYDWYCQLWWQEYDIYGLYSPYYSYYTYWCPSKAVYANHEVNGSIEVQVNGTQFF